MGVLRYDLTAVNGDCIAEGATYMLLPLYWVFPPRLCSMRVHLLIKREPFGCCSFHYSGVCACCFRTDMAA